ncbi:MAG: hypothetical protein FJ386_08690 [Verrucomicrobia bacterium]|nr:hypothetical protein [Verrucomicrobiota bacterium]
MKPVWKWTLRLGLVAVAVLVLFVVTVAVNFDDWTRAFVERRIREETGHEVRIGRLSIGLRKRELIMEKFVFYNTAEFGGGPMIDLPELRLELDPVALRADRLHFKLLRVNLAEVHIVSALDGASNFDALGKRLGMKPRERKLQFDGIDTLSLTLGRLLLTDLRRSPEPRPYRLGVEDQVIVEIKSEQDLRAKLIPVAFKVGASIARDALLPAKPPRKLPQPSERSATGRAAQPGC